MKAKLITVGAVAALIGLLWVLVSYQDWRLQYLYSHGRYEDFLKEAPKSEAYAAQRMQAITSTVKARCEANATTMTQQVGALQAGGRWEEIQKVSDIVACARYIPALAESLRLAPKKVNEAKAQALFAERGGKEAFLRKVAATEVNKPKEAVALTAPFEGLGDEQVDALRSKARAHDDAIMSAESDKAAKLAAARDKAERKKRGVRVGMTKQEVIDSSWGRPEHINRTTTASGTREQWVYGLGSYLYFDGDILTTIQN